MQRTARAQSARMIGWKDSWIINMVALVRDERLSTDRGWWVGNGLSGQSFNFAAVFRTGAARGQERLQVCKWRSLRKCQDSPFPCDYVFSAGRRARHNENWPDPALTSQLTSGSSSFSQRRLSSHQSTMLSAFSFMFLSPRVVYRLSVLTYDYH